MIKTKLMNKDEVIYTVNGKYMFSVPMTNRLIELNNDEDWNRDNESWLDHRKRIKKERDAEREKQVEYAKELARVWNGNLEDSK